MADSLADLAGLQAVLSKQNAVICATISHSTVLCGAGDDHFGLFTWTFTLALPHKIVEHCRLACFVRHMHASRREESSP